MVLYFPETIGCPRVLGCFYFELKMIIDIIRTIWLKFLESILLNQVIRAFRIP